VAIAGQNMPQAITVSLTKWKVVFKYCSFKAMPLHILQSLIRILVIIEKAQ
jgi:hypothetical protein